MLTDLQANPFSITGLAQANVVLGKNGCGKSHLLKTVDEVARHTKAHFGLVKYLSPERGGTLQYQPNIDHNIATNPGWLDNTRHRNQANEFRLQSMAQYRNLELLALRRLERDKTLRDDYTFTFDTTIVRINALLDRVQIVREGQTFKIYDADSKQVEADTLSSGETELLSLAIEVLVFQAQAPMDKDNLLIIDEPDVHLHPDLQARFAAFLGSILWPPTGASPPTTLIVATHSTPFLAALAYAHPTNVAFMVRGLQQIDFKPADETFKQLLPIFGAHPLSNAYNQSPLLLLEGEDDERIWQQAIRTSRGRLHFYPCAVGSVSELNGYETRADELMSVVYDNARGYSLRDSDGDATPLAPIGRVQRLKLACRNAENLLVADDTLTLLGTTWDLLRPRLDVWIRSNVAHPHYADMLAFRDSTFDRMRADIKPLRSDLVGLAGSNKPWEVAVGQAIAGLAAASSRSPTSLLTFLGKDVCASLLNLPGSP